MDPSGKGPEPAACAQGSLAVWASVAIRDILRRLPQADGGSHGLQTRWSLRAMKILILSRNLPPLTGGIERLMFEATSVLAACTTVDVIGPPGFAHSGVRCIRRHPFAILRFYPGALLTLLRVRRGDYDLVVAGSVLMAPLARFAAWRSDCRYLVFAHGLDVVYRSAIYQAVFLAAARHAHRVLANSSFTREQLELRGASSGRIEILHPGVHLPPASNGSQAFRRRHGLSGRPLLLGVGRIVPRKGFLEFVEDVLPRVVESFPEICFVLIGAEPESGRGRVVAAIREAVVRLGLQRNVLILGAMAMDSEELRAAYAAADLHVFPVRQIEGDPEGFGMVAIEAAAAGLATVAYATGGVVDAVDPRCSGRLVRPGGAVEFAQAVCELLGAPLSRDRVRRHAEQFSWQRYAQVLRRVVLEQCAEARTERR